MSSELNQPSNPADMNQSSSPEPTPSTPPSGMGQTPALPTSPAPTVGREGRRPGVTWPIILIGAGVLLLLWQLNLLPPNTLDILWRFWPVILILIGIDVLIGRHSTLGAIISALLTIVVIGGILAVLWLAPNIPWLANLPSTGFNIPSAQLRSQHIQYPLGGIRQATVHIELGSGSGGLRHLTDSTNLIEGDINTYQNVRFNVSSSGDRATVDLGTQGGSFFFFGGGSERWDLRLNPDIPLDLSLSVGSGSFDFDLSSLQLTGLRLDEGSGSVRVSLPPAKGQLQVRMDLGSGSLDITLPESTAARITLSRGSGSFQAGSRFRQVESQDRNGVWETDNYAQATDRIDLAIDEGSGSISVR